jgi:NAD(P)-dependent dehydrogenase (short-subunit alcohol dehydrogenase family)
LGKERNLELDVTDDNSVRDAIQAIVSEAERIDVLINNAGYGLTGALEDIDIDEFKEQYDTNVFGLVRATQAVIPVMRKQKKGIIVNISSGLGRFGIGLSSAYASSKFAVEGISESMSYELEPFGIRTIIVEPGIIKTNFLNSAVLAKRAKDPTSPYFQLIKGMEGTTKEMVERGTSPEQVADTILHAINDKTPKIRYLAGKDVEQIMEIKSKVSDEDFHKMLNQM